MVKIFNDRDAHPIRIFIQWVTVYFSILTSVIYHEKALAYFRRWKIKISAQVRLQYVQKQFSWLSVCWDEVKFTNYFDCSLKLMFCQCHTIFFCEHTQWFLWQPSADPSESPRRAARDIEKICAQYNCAQCVQKPLSPLPSFAILLLFKISKRRI